jgi:maltose/moltooligosaccharide transporter
MADKPTQDFRTIWNLCFGFFGIQFGLALQNSNLSRIFQTLGADVDAIPTLWIAAPLTGLLIQPVIGHYSDRTWGRFGRRRPYLVVGGLLAAIALVAMPNAPTLFVAAALLWLLDGAVNVAMGPIRALIGDALPHAQRAKGFAMQTFFISVGSVIASVMPWCLARMGVANVAGSGIPQTVKLSFYIGAVAMCGALLWTALKTREYSPQQLRAFDDAQTDSSRDEPPRPALERSGWMWTAAATLTTVLLFAAGADWQIVMLAAGALIYGLAKILTARRATPDLIARLVADLHGMPRVMRQLAPVQLFSWFGLFAMWTYTTAAVARTDFAANDAMSDAWNEGANWAGVLFAAYNAVTAVVAIGLPAMTRAVGLRGAHAINLVLGGLGLLSFVVIHDPRWLLASMVGVGFAWASILSVPYALLSDSVPPRRIGAYMGIFNLFIVIPQILAASVLGVVLKRFFDNAPIAGVVIGGVCFIVAGALTFHVDRR